MANFFKASNKKPNHNKIKSNLLININKLDMNGCGVGYYQNKPIFVDGCLPTERVEVRVIEQKNKYFRGKLLKVNSASEHRVDVPCQHFKLCGGCDLQHLSYNEQLLFKQKKVSELLSRSGVDADVINDLPWQNPIVSQPWHYRRKARIGVQFDKNAQATIGFRQKGTNQLVPIKSCPTLVKPLNDIFPTLQEIIAKLNGKKAIGHVEVISILKSQTEQVLTLVVRQLKLVSEQDRALWQSYAKLHQWQVLFDFGEGKVELLSDEKSLTYTLADGCKISLSHDDFIQVNQVVNEEMVKQAMDWLSITAEDQVLDLFCGLGNFSLPIAKKVSKVVGVEGVQSMVDKAKANALQNQLDNCQFFQADLNSTWLAAPWVQSSFNKVLLDPARAGAEQAVTQLSELAVENILYVSCDASTLARDTKLLVEKGYKIVKIGLIDMFSQTKHVETMVLFAK